MIQPQAFAGTLFLLFLRKLPHLTPQTPSPHSRSSLPVEVLAPPVPFAGARSIPSREPAPAQPRPSALPVHDCVAPIEPLLSRLFRQFPELSAWPPPAGPAIPPWQPAAAEAGLPPPRLRLSQPGLRHPIEPSVVQLSLEPFAAPPEHFSVLPN